MPQALLLDYGGVLARAQDAAAIRRLSAIAGLSADEFVQRYWRHRAAYDDGLPAADYWRLVVEPKCTPDVIEDLIRADVDSWTIYREPMWSLAAEFRARGGRIAMLSNGVPEIVDVIRRHREIEEFFDAVVISFEVGCSKPDPRIYRLCLEKLDVEARDALFVDDLQANLDAAAGLGLQTCLFSGDEDLPALRSRVLL